MTKRSAGPARTTEKERYYRELLRRQSRSGASIREVAEQEGIPSGRLRSWKSRIARLDRRRAETGRPIPLRAAKASAGTKPKESAARTESLSLPLLPVRVVGGREGAGVIEPGFEVLLRSGHVVRVPRSFETDSLGRLVQVLEAAC